MPSTREILSFVVETDASKAVAGFQQVEKSADSSLTKSEKSASNLGSTLTKVGAASVGAGLAMTAGLVGTVKAFEKSEEAADKFETSVTGMGSKIDTKAIEQLAFQLQQVSKATDNQIVSAARWGAVYGLTTDQLKTLLRVAVDLSAQTGQSIDATTKALARASTGGSTKVLTKWGLQFDETAMKANSFGETVNAAMEFAGGAAAKQADTMSGQLDRMGHNWTDVKEKIGAGANEVFEPLARGAADLSEKVASLNPDLLKTIGHFAAVGSVATTAFGGLASLGGQLVNIRDGFSGISGVADKAFSKVGLPIKDAEGQTTKFGKALGGAGTALGALGAAAALTETIVAINEATENTTRFETALNRLGKVQGTKDVGKQLKEMSDSSEGWGDKIVDVFTRIQTINIGGSVMDVDDLQESLDKLKDSSPEELARVLPTVQKALDGMTNKNPETEKLAGHVKDLGKWLSAQAGAATDAASGSAQYGAAVAASGVTTQEWSDSLKENHGALELVATGAGQAAAASKGFSDALDANATDEAVTSSLKLGDAFHGIEDSVKDLPKNFDETQAALGGYNDEQSKAIKSVTDWGAAAGDQIKTLIESGASTDQVTAKANVYTSALTGVMKQAGLSDDQIHTYLQTLGLTPEQVQTEINLSGDAQAKFTLQFMQGQLDKLDQGAQAEVLTLIDQGHYSEAKNKLMDLSHPVEVPLRIDMGAFNASIASARNQLFGGLGAKPTAASSSVAVAPVGVNPLRSTAPVVVTPPAANVTINMPAGTTPANTLRAIRRYQRLGGDMGGLLDTVVAIR